MYEDESQIGTRPDPAAILQAMQNADKWMIRRKDTVRFSTEQDISRSHSFDFEVPDYLIRTSVEGRSATVPLGFWWKAPGRYHDVDFVDDTDRSLGLSTSSADKSLTLSVMLEYASRVWGVEKHELPFDVAARIFLIVTRDEVVDTVSEVNRGWDFTNAHGQSSDEDIDEFLRMLEISALASIVTARVHEGFDRRRIVKLRYGERQSGYFRTDVYKLSGYKSGDGGGLKSNFNRRIRLRARKLRDMTLYFLGLGTYRLDVYNAFVKAQSYHFESYSPGGLHLTKTSLRVGTTEYRDEEPLTPRAHLHGGPIDQNVMASARSKLVVTDEWVSSAIVCTLVSAGVLYGIWHSIGDLDSDAARSVITVVLLVPSVAMTIVWRRVHWLVDRLHKVIRYLFLSVAVLSFYIVLLIATSSTEVRTVELSSGKKMELTMLTDQAQIVVASKWVFWWAVFVSAVLVAARFHPARVRSLWRRIRRKR